MLVMRRREGEAIRIGEDVEIRILSIKGSKVKIGISAPRSVAVSAYEIELVRNQNMAAAHALQDAPDIVAHLLQACTPKEIPDKMALVSDLK